MPDISQVHVNMALTNVSLAYKNPAFISDILAPVVGVRKQQDNYFILDPEREAFRSTPDQRSPGAVANEVDFAPTPSSLEPTPVGGRDYLVAGFVQLNYLDSSGWVRISPRTCRAAHQVPQPDRRYLL